MPSAVHMSSSVFLSPSSHALPVGRFMYVQLIVPSSSSLHKPGLSQHSVFGGVKHDVLSHAETFVAAEKQGNNAEMRYNANRTTNNTRKGGKRRQEQRVNNNKEGNNWKET